MKKIKKSIKNVPIFCYNKTQKELILRFIFVFLRIIERPLQSINTTILEGVKEMGRFGEIVTAMVTPFDERGEIYLPSAQKLAQYLYENGTDSIVVSGTTGEGPTLSKKEKLFLFEAVKNVSDEKMVIANIGSNNTKESIELAQKVEKHGLSDALLVVNPYYNKPNQEGLYQHFKAIAESVDLPIMLYNIPGRTSVNLQADTCIRLAEIPNIVAVKESSGDLSQMAHIIEQTSDDFEVYSGDDNLTLPLMAIGGSGVVSVASHLVGKQIKEMMTAYNSGDTIRAGNIHRQLLPFMEGIFLSTNPVPIKWMLNKIGMEVGGVRLPLVGLNEMEEKRANELLNQFVSLT